MRRELAGDCGRRTFRLPQKKFSQKFCTSLNPFQIGTQTGNSFRPQSCQHTVKGHKRLTTAKVNSCFKKKCVLFYGKVHKLKNVVFFLTGLPLEQTSGRL